MGQNPSEEELNGIIMEIDIDGSGTIDFMEFVELMKDKASEIDIDNDIRFETWSYNLDSFSINRIYDRDAFRIFDRNRDGYIDMAELRKMFAMVGGVFSREEMEEFMDEADKAISDILIIYLWYNYLVYLGWQWKDWLWRIHQNVETVWLGQTLSWTN